MIIVDGGVNQINACKDIISSLGLDIPICGLKKDNHHSTNTLITEDLKEIDLKKDSDLFLFLTKMQDEVHRYTISYHKQIRSKGALSSILDNIPGIGEQFVKSILTNDYPTIMGITMVYCIGLVVILLITDIIYGLIDPRIRLDESEA